MQAIWKGHITFGLVSVPVALYSATSDGGISFNLLHAKDNSPIKYRKVCEREGTEVPPGEIVRAYQYEKDQYVVLDDKDFEKVDVVLSKTINIVNFVKIGDVDPMWFDKPYYLEPGEGGQTPYELLRRALAESGFVGIARTVLRNREHLACLLPRAEIMVLELMRYSNELRDTAKLNKVGRVKVDKKQLDLAKELINRMAGDFRYDEYTDEYTVKLMDIIRKKAAGKRIVAPKAPRAPEVKNLMEALERSLKEAA